jgi:hypothetical protein
VLDEPPSLNTETDTGPPARQARPLGHKTRRIVLSTPRKAKVGIVQARNYRDSNTRIIQGLTRIYGEDKANAIIGQAQELFIQQNSRMQYGELYVPNNPEVSELFENGQIDEALEMFGANWVIGRPRN